MSEPFIAEIRIFAGNFAPRSWAFCDGQLLPISNNTALFSLIGTIYGGDGRTTTALPNMQGRAPMHPGRGPGLTPRQIGQRNGTETVTLSENQMPAHSHSANAANAAADVAEPATTASFAAVQGRGKRAYHSDTNENMVTMADVTIGANGGNQAHENQQPFLAMNFIIALQGLYPSRS